MLREKWVEMIGVYGLGWRLGVYEEFWPLKYGVTVNINVPNLWEMHRWSA